MKAVRLFSIVAAFSLVAACKSAEAPKSDATPANAPAAQTTPKANLGDIKDPSAKLDKAIELALSTVYFEFDSASLTQAATENLSHMADAMKQLPTARVSIEAHSDRRGSNEYNLALSQRRGEAIRDFLVSAGVDAKALEVKAFGEEMPAVDAATEEAYAKNRRGEFKRLN